MGFPYWGDGVAQYALLLDSTGLDYWGDGRAWEEIIAVLPTVTPDTNRSATTCASPTLLEMFAPAGCLSHTSCSQAGILGLLTGLPAANSITTSQDAFLMNILHPNGVASLTTCQATLLKAAISPGNMFLVM